jgi:epsilon-lactone hydrolase
MPSQAMQDAINALRDRQKASAGQALPTLEQRRAAFVPGDRLHPVPDDVLVREVTAGGARPLARRSRSGHRTGAPVPARRRL